jgi:hypothetical protein
MLRYYSFLIAVMKNKVAQEESAFLRAQNVLALIMAINLMSLTFILFGRHTLTTLIAFIIWVCFYVALLFFAPRKKVLAYRMNATLYSRTKTESQILLFITVLLLISSIVATI